MEEIIKFFDGPSAVDVAEIANAEMKEGKLEHVETVEENKRE